MSLIGHVLSAGSPYQPGWAQGSATVAYTMPPATNEKFPMESLVYKGTDSTLSQLCIITAWLNEQPKSGDIFISV